MANDIREANGHEMVGIEMLAALDAHLIRDEEHLQDRLKTIPNAWRDYRLAKSLIEKIVGKLYDTLPQKQLLHMQRLASTFEVVVRPKPFTKRGAYMSAIDNLDLKVLINTVMNDECAMCLKDYRECKKCPIRSALMNVAPPNKVGNNSFCEYRNITVQREDGDYL